MDIETLKQSNKRKYIVGLIVISVMVVTITYIGTRAKYRVTNSTQLASGVINYSPSDLEIVSIKIQNNSNGYDNSDTVPTSGYTLNKELSVCKVGETKQDVTITYESGKVGISGITTKGTKCEIYFDKQKAGKDLILANNTIDTSRSSGYFPAAFTADTAGKIFSAEDDDGTTYFFAGSNPNNWVQFGGYYWRIIRINGDGSIRLIYNGSTTEQTGATTQIGKNVFNTSFNDNAFVGYMYGKTDSWKDGGQSTSISSIPMFYQSYLFYGTEYKFNSETGKYSLAGTIIQDKWTETLAKQMVGQYTCRSTVRTEECTTLYKIVSYGNNIYGNVYSYSSVGENTTTYTDTHANTNSSTIKTYLDNWYTANLKTNYEQYIDTSAGFCGDRTVDNYEEGYTGDGSGKTKTEYASLKRVYNTHIATYKCSNSNDYYTVRTSSKGNKALENPAGLITSDEVMYAGGYYSGTQNHWLKTGQDYWTLSPVSFDGSYTYVNRVDSSGAVNYFDVDSSYGMRPVINLKADTLKIGSGTTTDPYRID